MVSSFQGPKARIILSFTSLHEKSSGSRLSISWSKWPYLLQWFSSKILDFGNYKNLDKKGVKIPEAPRKIVYPKINHGFFAGYSTPHWNDSRWTFLVSDSDDLPPNPGEENPLFRAQLTVLRNVRCKKKHAWRCSSGKEIVAIHANIYIYTITPRKA